ncbi:sodium:solute symporter family protein [Pseudokordiimonas caeni]|uniref:sodium:solute symporter family protein n=1 Tax=Pseudokordiimonas caeni TaxID=2997908 RepID=UPI002812208A|nr:sodium:solute symporter family protein [Pseudokordiimonas caeni]
MLLGFVIAYWVVSVGIGLYASMRVKNTADFAIAGRHLPFYMVTCTVFATWFGAEAVLGIPATFLEEGLSGIVADPFGTAACLILVGILFASPLYRMKLLTIGDFYKRRFGRETEVITSLAIVVSYLGWVAAQITALGLVFNVVSGGEISTLAGMWIGSVTILIYTFFGGMWAVAITDLIQMVIIVIGMLYIGGEVTELVGGVDVVINHASEAGKFNFWPDMNFASVIAFVAAFVTMAFGSMPQQDIFQRVQSAKTEKIAVWATIVGGGIYFLFAFIPMFLAYAATLIDPEMSARWMEEDSQMILPSLVLSHAPLVAQILFFGALLSAIKSCASATLLAPSVTFTENILRPMMKRMSDKQLLAAMRTVTAIFTLMVTVYAIYSDASIFEMVENAYQITLVVAFIPLVCGVYWKGATKQGALLSMAMGFIVWVGVSILGPEEPLIPSQFAGLIAAIIGMIVGSFAPQMLKHDHTVHERLKKGEMGDEMITVHENAK